MPSSRDEYEGAIPRRLKQAFGVGMLALSVIAALVLSLYGGVRAGAVGAGIVFIGIMFFMAFAGGAAPNAE